MPDASRPERPADPSASRRSFIKGGGFMLAGGAIAAGPLGTTRGAHAMGSDTIRVGLIGCGSRGTAAAMQMLGTAGGEVRLVAMADAFDNHLHRAYRTIKGQHAGQLDLEQSRFSGLKAYANVLASDADVVILATPPGFRPQHFEAAIDAGKHVFMEKPVATDSPGVRRVLAAGEKASRLGLAVQVGLQRRHETRYRQCIDKLQQGMIGDLVYARTYWNGGGTRSRSRKAGQSELEFQLRNWCHFAWLGGDAINEQHIHNLDVINWLKQSYPVEAQGQGGRSASLGNDRGQTFDHHMVEYTYADGFKMFGQCRHAKGCWNAIGEHVHGIAGSCDIANAVIRDRQGKKLWQSDAKEPRGKGWQQEQDDWVAALRNGERPNETRYAAMSTMTALLGRAATYGGKVVRWQDVFDDPHPLADTDSLASIEDAAPLSPNASGCYPVPSPGRSGDRA